MNLESTNEYFMSRALELAARGMWSTGVNPRVGCVIVKDQQIIAEGWHEQAAKPHAEMNALGTLSSEEACGATVFVTLEPCAHYGKTGPCAEALIHAQIKTVYCAVLDPNPQVAGKGVALLRQAGIDVHVGLLESQASEINCGFFKRMQTSQPYVRLKIACSLDGKMAMSTGESQWITGPQARAEVHQYRARSNAILTGVGTVNADNPSLTARPQLNPDWHAPTTIPRVILDRQLRINPEAKLLRDGYPVIIYSHNKGKIAGAEVKSVPKQHDFLLSVLGALGQAECNEVWLEAGPRLVGAFIEKQLIDELIVYMAPKILGAKAQSFSQNIDNISVLSDAYEYKLVEARHIGEDCKMVFQPISSR